MENEYMNIINSSNGTDEERMRQRKLNTARHVSLDPFKVQKAMIWQKIIMETKAL